MANKFVHKSWRPDRPTSKGAAAYHNAVIDASWHKKNIYELIRLVRKIIKDDDIVIDFGAGTGSSSLYLLKKLKGNFKLCLVDNSPSWLGKAHEQLYTNPRVTFSIVEKIGDRYAMLHETIGKEMADHVVSANTVHLIPNIGDAFTGIYHALRSGGTFTFQSGNIVRGQREKEVLMIDDTVNMVHDIAIEIIKTGDVFKKYREGLTSLTKKEFAQRKLVFPNPRKLQEYIKILRNSGFKNEKVSLKKIRVRYKDWLAFLRVKRLQAGILPEVGGKNPSPKEEQDRDTLIVMASSLLFKTLAKENPFATKTSFIAEWIYIQAEK